jgi:hypothetical protein
MSSKTKRDPEKDDPAYNLCETSSSLLKDLRNQAFEEAKYRNMKLD